MPTAAPQPISRRNRPAKPALSREAIVAAAVNVLRTEGLERLTMRRLAAALDTGAGSLYVYFRNAEHLYAALLDQLLGQVDLSAGGPDRPWRERLAGVLESYTQVLFENPSIARMSISTRPSGPHSLHLLETLLDLLDEGGVTPGAAAWGSDLLLQYATATAAEHATRDQRVETADEETDLSLALAAVTAAAYPRLHQVKDLLFAGEAKQRFRWGIDVLLAGLSNEHNARLPRSYESTHMGAAP